MGAGVDTSATVVFASMISVFLDGSLYHGIQQVVFGRKAKKGEQEKKDDGGSWPKQAQIQVNKGGEQQGMTCKALVCMPTAVVSSASAGIRRDLH